LKRTAFLGGQIPLRGRFAAHQHPFLVDIPVVGKIFEQQPIAVGAIVLVIVAIFCLVPHTMGSAPRAVGEHPRAAGIRSVINVYKMRYWK
jgi:simple sugar transport system permease protein